MMSIKGIIILISLSAIIAFALSKTGVSRRMINYIKSFEGLRLDTYIDAAGKPTIGYGHLIKRGESFPGVISKFTAEKLLLQDISVAEKCIELHVRVPLNQNQRDALVSFIYNVGCGAFIRSTLLRVLNDGYYAAAASQFSRWNKAGGIKLAGLTNRRQKEFEIFTA